MTKMFCWECGKMQEIQEIDLVSTKTVGAISFYLRCGHAVSMVAPNFEMYGKRIQVVADLPDKFK